MYSEIKIIEGPGDLLRRVKCVTIQIFQEINSGKIKHPKVVFLDYDNSLVDSWPQDFETSNEVFKRLDLPTMTAVEMLQAPHMSAVRIISDRTQKSYEDVKKIYNEVYEKVHNQLAPPVPGAEDLLKYLRDNKICTIIISNKEHDLLESTLKKIGWIKYVDAYHGVREGGLHKPNPDVVNSMLKRHNLNFPKDEIFLVGDAVSTDIQCALSSGIIPVWLSEYSVDELTIGKAGPYVLKVQNCKKLVSLLNSVKRG